MNRRGFCHILVACAAARKLLAEDQTNSSPRFGLCTFSSHQAWGALDSGGAEIPFQDADSFLAYAQSLGAIGVQCHFRRKDSNIAKAVRRQVEKTGGYFEGDLRLPKTKADVAAFDLDIRLAKEAGASLARSFLLAGRRYETFKTLAEFRAFQAEGERRLALAEPVLRKHGLKLALENHKDQTVPEMLAMLKKFSSEWLGVCVDTGNNMALLEEPHEVIQALAPHALSVHLKDMAVQLDAEGFLLSEVPLGQGCLDLPKIIATLRQANPAISFNIEMATRDPLKVPCLAENYWASFPGPREADLQASLTRARTHPPKQAPPTVQGMSTTEKVAAEARNNRLCLDWMRAR